MDTAAQLAEQVQEARRRTLALVADLTDEQLIGPYLSIVNPLLWEIGHVAWFQERWALRHALQQKSACSDWDAIYNSAEVLHRTRWKLPLPRRDETLSYMRQVFRRVLDSLARPGISPEQSYFVQLSVFHEDMHAEAILYTRQTLGYPAPALRDEIFADQTSGPTQPIAESVWPKGDRELPGGRFMLGATADQPFVFDNEKWAHPIEIKPFKMARVPVTQGEYAEFVNDGGYRHRDFWSEAGWDWRVAAQATHPVYWKEDTSSTWLRRHFDEWAPLELIFPMVHVNWFEAEAYCAYAKRRLPTEAEWEAAAAAEPDQPRRRLSAGKRLFPWGAESPTAQTAHLGSAWIGGLPVDAHTAGDSAFGVRQMIGNVWEWTGSRFLPYPGFVVDPYREYSQPWFGTHWVLRGGSWATTARLIRNTWRNFYTPDRRDIFAGFRTCAPSD
ncbi:MAG: ergothioneine biosynthesis protein EgtB [Acidobacteria bacterium]|nr:ergothioneine biosynthesis protein EgtB [Acidobacteriota bacterium]MBI3657862.1 ergothioneine biosynthesis protein EgtB [Acidobacteriota bacterium]